MIRTLDLFSGIGGFALGLERTGGFHTAAFCEIDPFARRVLAKHWPQVRRYHDVTAISADRLAADGIAIDAICGGFPCQDISVAGKGIGLDGSRSGLWREFARLIGEIRPAWVIAENVPALRNRGADRVFADLEALGYAWWAGVVGAVHVGAPHQRNRVWIIAHAKHGGCEGRNAHGEGPSAALSCGADAHANSARLEIRQSGNASGARQGGWPDFSGMEWWATEPAVGRVAHGVPDRVDRLRCLGNAVVPVIPELLGRTILSVTAKLAERQHAA
jgi:DNA (cytosine-5)-methyltransferase 1